jgi:hypothetical protein
VFVFKLSTFIILIASIPILRKMISSR